MTAPVSILLVDDREEDLLVLQSVLAAPGRELVVARSGPAALRRVLERDFALILLDVRMPGMDGFEVAAIIKERERSRLTPILFLTAGGSDVGTIYRGYSVGAVDCLSKPVDRDVLRAKVEIFVALFQKDRQIKQQAEALREADRRERELQIAELRLSGERRYRNLAEAIPHIVWTVQPDGELNHCNQQWTEYTGLSVAQTRAAGWLSAVHADDAERCWQAWARTLATGVPFAEEYRLKRRDGAYRWHLGRAVPERDARGEPAGWIGTATDCDDLKRAHQHADAGQRRAAFLAEASALLAVSLDHGAALSSVAGLAVASFCDWCVIDVVEKPGEEPAPAALAHRDPERESRLRTLRTGRVPGWVQRVLRTGKPELLAEVTDEQLAFLAEGRADDVEALRKIGLRSAMVAPLIARDRTLGAVTFVSAFDDRRFDEADLAMTADLASRCALAIDNAFLYREAKDAIRARDEFLSVASHELRTPLTPLQLQVQGVLRLVRKASFGGSTSSLVERLEVAERQVHRLAKLIDTLLDVSRISAKRLTLDLESVDLTNIVQETLTRLSAELGKAGCIVTFVVPAQIQGTWDRLRLEQIVTNLLSNAMKYGSGAPIEIELESEHGMARLTVRDHGQGIAPDDQQRIFRRFERAASQRHVGGLGLGLWIVSQIVDALGGSIRVESALGEGATFTVELPRARSAAAAAQPAAERRTSGP